MATCYVGGCAEAPACKTVLNESDFQELIGQYNVAVDKLGKHEIISFT